MRGGEVLVAVCTRPGPPEGELPGAAGRWRDVLYGDERELEHVGAPWRELLDEYGIAVLERASDARPFPVESGAGPDANC